jgi:hypothetical protein
LPPLPQRAVRSPAAAPPSHVTQLLGLQRTAGNTAVVRLLRTPSGTSTARDRFQARLRDRWAVTRVSAGTEANQVDEMRRMTPSSDAAPTSLIGWQRWDPGANSDLYADILSAFEAMAGSLGGVPDVNELRFLAVDYENVGGNAVARPQHGATFSAGLLDVFRRMENASWPLPTGRSSGTSPASLTTGAPSDSRRRIIVHELSHGVFERFGNPNLPGGSPQLFRQWEQAAGWSNGQIIENGTPVTPTNWNQDRPEQPVSAYSLANSMEDFAESLLCYVENPTVLRDRSPSRHQFIDSRVGSWRSGLRQPQAASP